MICGIPESFGKHRILGCITDLIESQKRRKFARAKIEKNRAQKNYERSLMGSGLILISAVWNRRSR
jgi:hypothetical protein